MRSKHLIKSVGIFAAMALMMSTAAFAASNLSAWCEVPAFNGSEYSEDSAKKETTGSSAYLYDATVGGGYQVDCRQHCISNNVNGAWTRDISTVNNAGYMEGTTRMLKDTVVCLEFSNDLLTSVRVEVNGTWDSN